MSQNKQSKPLDIKIIIAAQKWKNLVRFYDGRSFMF